ncbi:helicase associated domain-containing protein [Streptomyces sp. NPDC001020]
MSLQALRRNSGPRFSAWRHLVGKQLPARASLLGPLVPAAGWAPDFLTPGPGHATPTTGAFDAIRATPRRRLAAELSRLSSHHRLPAWTQLLADGDREALDAVADILAAYYDVAITPFADRMRTVLDADRAWRAHTMAHLGVGAVLDNLHPQVRWEEPVLELPGPPGQGRIDLHLEGRGLLLSAHIFCGSRPRALLNEVDTPVLVYAPVWNLGRDSLVAEPPGTRPRASTALATLLGRTRAAVLEALTSPVGHSTKQLAESLAISAASASEHVTALRDAGLVTSLRQANTMRHTTTALGTPSWCPSWPVEWQRAFHLVRLHLEAGRPLPTKPGDVMHQGEDLGRWVRSVRLGWDNLTGVQQWMCEQVLGIEPAAEDEKPPPRRTQADKWAMNYEAAKQFYEREGHLRVPRKHVERIVGEDQEERELRLGAWIGNQRSRAATLSPERVELLSAIGMRWS